MKTKSLLLLLLFLFVTSIPFNQKVSDTISESNQVHYYSFNLPSAGQLKLDIEFYMNYLGIQIFDINATNIESNSFSWSSAAKKANLQKIYELDKGRYTIKLLGNYSERSYYSSYFGNYNFLLKFISAGMNHKEPNNIELDADSLPISGKTYGHIAKNNQLDYYKIVLPTAGKYSISTTYYFNYLGIQIIDSKFNVLYSDSYSWTQAASKGMFSEVYELDKGTYYIKFIGNYSESADYSSYFGKYEIKVSRKIVTKPAKVNFSTIKSPKSKNVTFSWKKVSGAEGYTIEYSSRKSFSGKKVIHVSKSRSNYSISRLKGKVTYYFRIKAFKKDGSKKIYGSYSNVKKITVKNRTTIFCIYKWGCWKI